MKKRGFTLIEMMIALSLSAIILSAITGMLFAVWSIVKESSDELQGALMARYARERLLYNLATENDKTFGLINATNIYVDASEIVANFPLDDGSYKTVSITAAKKAPYWRDNTSSREYRAEDKALQCVYLGVKLAKYSTYYDRIVVPVFGRHPEATDGTSTEVLECFK